MSEYAPREATNASRFPSGDQAGDTTRPRIVNTRCAADEPSTGANQAAPSFKKTNRRPSAEMLGELPSPIRRGAPPETGTLQISTVAPWGDDRGLAADPPSQLPPELSPRT